MGSSTSKRVNWTYSQGPSGGSTRGSTFLLVLPSAPAGASASVNGTITAGPGVSVNACRLIVTRERSSDSIGS